MSTQENNSLKKNPFEDFKKIEPHDFRDHIRTSIPCYDYLEYMVLRLSEYHAQGMVADLGCSDGHLVKELTKQQISAVGIEPSETFCKYLTDRVIPHVKGGYEELETMTPSLITSLFTLQFIPRYQQKLVIKLIAERLKLQDDNTFILAEKFHSGSVVNETQFNSIYYEHKHYVFDGDNILDKERNLRKIMQLSTIEERTRQLEKAGFKDIEIFWAAKPFYALICRV